MISHTNKAHRQDLPVGPGRGWGKVLENLVQIKSCNVAILSVRNGKAFVCRHWTLKWFNKKYRQPKWTLNNIFGLYSKFKWFNVNYSGEFIFFHSPCLTLNKTLLYTYILYNIFLRMSVKTWCTTLFLMVVGRRSYLSNNLRKPNENCINRLT